MRALGFALALLVFSGCESPGPAPIRDNAPPKSATKPVAKPVTVKAIPEPRQTGQHVVQKGETLYAIAFQNGLDYRDLAFWNNLASPDVINAGQVLRLTPPDDAASRGRGVETRPMRDTALQSQPVPLEETAPLLNEPLAQRLPYSEANWAALSVAKAAPAREVPKITAAPRPDNAAMQASEAQEGWRWPAEGALLGAFGEGGGKGIDIGGERHAPVMAASSGKVVYSGTGLRGYGKILIVKHADEFLSAYAHNQTLLVKEGDWVKGGQKIAEMGDTESDRVKLHFEVRQYGKPLDPLKYLPERK